MAKVESTSLLQETIDRLDPKVDRIKSYMDLESAHILDDWDTARWRLAWLQGRNAAKRTGAINLWLLGSLLFIVIAGVSSLLIWNFTRFPPTECPSTNLVDQEWTSSSADFSLQQVKLDDGTVCWRRRDHASVVCLLPPLEP
jgi:hypothetical protein